MSYAKPQNNATTTRLKKGKVLAALGAFVAPFHAFYNNFLKNLSRLQKNVPQTLFWPLLALLVLPMMLIKSYRDYKKFKRAGERLDGQDAQHNQHSKRRKMINAVVSILYMGAATITVFSGLSGFFAVMGVSASVLPVAAGLCTGVICLLQLCYAHNVTTSANWTKNKERFAAAWAHVANMFRKKENQSPCPRSSEGQELSKTHIANWLLGETLTASFAVMSGFLAATAFPFAPLAIPVGLVVASIIYFDFSGFLPNFYGNIATNISSLFHHRDEAWLNKHVPNEPKERAWMHSHTRYAAYALAVGMSIFLGVMTMGVFPGVLGIMAGVLTGLVTHGGFVATLKNMYHWLSDEEKVTQAANSASENVDNKNVASDFSNTTPSNEPEKTVVFSAASANDPVSEKDTPTTRTSCERALK